jgi:hypothetical protein
MLELLSAQPLKRSHSRACVSETVGLLVKLS